MPSSSVESYRTLSLAEVKRYAKIPSGYVTDRVFRLVSERRDSERLWHLREEVLDHPFSKTYDSGDVDEWLESYSPDDGRRRFVFLAAPAAGVADGLMTYRPLQWNNTFWLVDIRVRREVRRRGIGSTLLAVLQDRTREEGRRGIAVETQVTNYPAVSFYVRHGFEIAGFHDHLYSNDDLATGDIALFLFWEAHQT